MKREISQNEKPDYPIIIALARDWHLYQSQELISQNFKVSEGWIVGFLIQEKKDSFIVAAEYFHFDDDEDSVRYTQVIPKETVIWHRIFKEW